MRWAKLVLLASAGVADSACVATTLAPRADAGDLALLAGVHVLSAAGAAVAAYLAAPVRASQRARFALLAFVLCLFVPGIGPFGIAATCAVGLGAELRRRDEPWLTFDWDPDLARSRSSGRARRRTSVSAIAAILRDLSPERAGRRFQALLATRRLGARDAVRLLKLALKDPSDEVRLFAFARIERMRGDVEASVRQLGAALEEADPEDRPVLALRLAQANWEIAYLGLAEGAVREHALRDARLHATEACRARPRTNAPAEFLLGRVLLAQGKHGRAHDALRRALDAGYARSRALPYLAECEYRLRRWKDVRATMRELAFHGVPPPLQGAAEFWR
jgi:tetratricopeptide (TPR) repeat protein